MDRIEVWGLGFATVSGSRALVGRCSPQSARQVFKTVASGAGVADDPLETSSDILA